MSLAQQAASQGPIAYFLYVLIPVAAAMVVYFGWPPLYAVIRRQEAYYDHVLRGQLLMDIQPRTMTFVGVGLIVGLAVIAYSLSSSAPIALLGGAIGMAMPPLIVKLLRSHRLYRLEDQLVDGIQTLTSGVRAGLNLVQAMQLLANNSVRPIGEEFGHLVREYEHGISFERAMMNAAERIGSSNYRLLFSALLTHRERGGDLGETLERIADSIREIYRLEKRIETLTAPGRTAARWMGAMPAVIMLILYYIDPRGIELLFTTDIGKFVLAVIVLMNILGFLWIRKIVAIDI